MMFRKKENQTTQDEPICKPRNWFKISVYFNIAVVVIAALVAADGYVVHQSDTNPQLCATWHLMESHVDSYLTSNHLDNVHEQANVECKDCHDYPLQAEITSGINYLIGNYTVVSADNPELEKRVFEDEMCL